MSKGGGFDLTSGLAGKNDKGQALSTVEKYIYSLSLLRNYLSLSIN